MPRDTHNANFNVIMDGRIRATPVGNWHWNEERKLWVVWAHKWNRFSKTWSEPQLMHCKEFESEINKMSWI